LTILIIGDFGERRKGEKSIFGVVDFPEAACYYRNTSRNLFQIIIKKAWA